jgi:hypothetical protein
LLQLQHVRLQQLQHQHVSPEWGLIGDARCRSLTRYGGLIGQVMPAIAGAPPNVFVSVGRWRIQ